MTKLLMAIDRRARYLDKAFPMGRIRPREAMIPIELPAPLMPSIEKIYGAEAEQRNESPIVTMIRHAAGAGTVK